MSMLPRSKEILLLIFFSSIVVTKAVIHLEHSTERHFLSQSLILLGLNNMQHSFTVCTEPITEMTTAFSSLSSL